MVSNRITEGVGKKIVEALKKQSDEEIQNIVDNHSEDFADNNFSSDLEFTSNSDDFENVSYNEENSENNIQSFQPQNFTNLSQPITHAQTNFEKETFAADLNGFEIPSNITILKQLINQLPSGVSKQTGALIIKQTMEALGISMKNVLQEAQQVQESLNNSQRECQNSILEYKKQINLLEAQAQKYQKQYSALNDIISLFIQTNF